MQGGCVNGCINGCGVLMGVVLIMLGDGNVCVDRGLCVHLHSLDVLDYCLT